MKKYTKEEAVSIVVRCAETYHNELEGKTLLFICMNKHKQTLSFEFSFHGHNYMHLTGLKSGKSRADSGEKLYANDFYQKCLDHKLSTNDFEFSEDGTTHMKLEVLPHVLYKNLRANMVGDYNSAKPRLYTEKIVGSTRACVGFAIDSRTMEYVPNTVIRENAQNLTSNMLRVIAVFRKRAQAEAYKELTYKAKKIDWDTIRFPDAYAYLLTLPMRDTE